VQQRGARVLWRRLNGDTAPKFPSTTLQQNIEGSSVAERSEFCCVLGLLWFVEELRAGWWLGGRIGLLRFLPGAEKGQFCC
jgi:hypothetical protein